MRCKMIAAFGTFCLLSVAVYAQDITGNIEIKRRLSKPNVAPPVSVYQRGTVVKLGHDAASDPIAYERSRVALYLEGPLPQGLERTESSHPTPVQQVQQLDRRFVPDFVVIPAGASVSFPNADPIFHNIYSLSKPKSFDLGNYDQGESRTVTFSKPGIVDVYCHLHSNMSATVFVVPNRWYARPDATGAYKIPNVPPGEYTVVAWHKTAGYFRKKVIVEAGHSSTVDFFIPLDADAPSTPEGAGAGASK